MRGIRLGITASAGNSFLTEKFEDIAIIWSMFKRHKEATVCQRVRETNTNTELDIGFKGRGYDEATYDTHVGAGTGRLRLFYDQSGNNHHIGWETAAQQNFINSSVSPYGIPYMGASPMRATNPGVITGTMFDVHRSGITYYEVSMTALYTRYNHRPSDWLETIVFNRTLSSHEIEAVIADIQRATGIQYVGVDWSKAVTPSMFSYRWEILTYYPFDMSSVVALQQVCQQCSTLTSLPQWNFASATNLRRAFLYCTNLAHVHAGAFDNCPATASIFSQAFDDTFTGCALTAQSIENILVSLDTAGGLGLPLGLDGGTNASKATWSPAANAAYDNLVAKGWTIDHNV